MIRALFRTHRDIVLLAAVSSVLATAPLLVGTGSGHGAGDRSAMFEVPSRVLRHRLTVYPHGPRVFDPGARPVSEPVAEVAEETAMLGTLGRVVLLLG